jgi:hypothetical protein
MTGNVIPLGGQFGTLQVYNTVKPIQSYQNTFPKLPLAKTVDLGHKPINIIHFMGMVTHFQSSHFQALRSCISTLHST